MPRPLSATTSVPEADVDLDLVVRVRVAVARLSRQLRQQSGDGLSPTLQSALVSIEKRGPLTLGELAQIEQVAPATVTKIVGKLTDAGLVARITDRDDRRVTRVELTAAGDARLAESRGRRNAFLATRLRELGVDTRALADTAELLERLAEPSAPAGPPSDDDAAAAPPPDERHP